MKKIAVLISGSGSNLQAIIDACAENKIAAKVDLVISSRKSAFGLERAKNAGIDAIYSRDDKHIFELLIEHEIDLVVLAGYLRLIPETMVQYFEGRMLNIHPSLIPAFSGEGYYGIKVHEAAIARGVKVSGATVHLVNEELDQGEILIQRTVPVLKTDDATTLQGRILEVEHQIIVEGINVLLSRL